MNLEIIKRIAEYTSVFMLFLIAYGVGIVVTFISLSAYGRLVGTAMPGWIFMFFFLLSCYLGFQVSWLLLAMVQVVLLQLVDDSD